VSGRVPRAHVEPHDARGEERHHQRPAALLRAAGPRRGLSARRRVALSPDLSPARARVALTAKGRLCVVVNWGCRLTAQPAAGVSSSCAMSGEGPPNRTNTKGFSVVIPSLGVTAHVGAASEKAGDVSSKIGPHAKFETRKQQTQKRRCVWCMGKQMCVCPSVQQLYINFHTTVTGNQFQKSIFMSSARFGVGGAWSICPRATREA